jgi:hypothetical protein
LGSDTINAVNRVLRASFPAAGDFEKDSWNVLVASPRRLASSGTVERKWRISLRGRNPQKPVNGVNAIVISGLWLSSDLANAHGNTFIILWITGMEFSGKGFIRMSLNTESLLNREDFEKERKFPFAEFLGYIFPEERRIGRENFRQGLGRFLHNRRRGRMCSHP